MKKILVIDDNRDLCKSISKFLSRQGYKVFQAYDGMEGFSIVRMENPDLIITDIVMPDMDGIDFFSEIEKHNKDIPIVVMSGEPLGKKVMDSLCSWGAVGKLEKPFDMGELLVKIKEILK